MYQLIYKASNPKATSEKNQRPHFITSSVKPGMDSILHPHVLCAIQRLDHTNVL